MSTLIVTEKNISARKIADILSGGRFATEKNYNVPVYVFSRNGDSYRSIGLKGHILRSDFPEEYQRWEKVDPRDLTTASIVKVPIQQNLIKALRSEARKAIHLIVATDFDREGELIGVDALRIAQDAKPDLAIARARFSALTKSEIEQAFGEGLNTPYYSLAEAGEARQDIDLIWGAALTRYISLASRRLGNQFLSVGRVQSPTLCLIAKREREIRAFVPEPYWQVLATFTRDGVTFAAYHTTERFATLAEAETVRSNIPETATVSSVVREEKPLASPTPFNTTEFLTAASSAGVPPARAMRAAENLYMQGYVSYPRVDNTVYPPSLDLRAIIGGLTGYDPVRDHAESLLAAGSLTPTRGKRQATDHPPIHPTGEVPTGLSGDDAKVFDLIVRRFLATLSPPAIIEYSRVGIDAGGEAFGLRGTSVVFPGFLAVYTYAKRKDESVPPVAEGDTLSVDDVAIEEKQTQPPARYSQAKLLRLMEDQGLGTKATRHQIIQNLYDRGYVTGNPLSPTELGLALADILLRHMEPIATPDMTAGLETEMDAIAEGRMKKERVVDDSRTMLVKVLTDLEAVKDEVREDIYRGLRGDQVVGVCPNCDGELRIVRSKKTKKRFVGCANYPECKTTYPLPQQGGVLAEDKPCPDCDGPRVKILKKGRRPWVICIDPKCPGREQREGKTSDGASKS